MRKRGPEKTVPDMLLDAEEIIRKKNAEITDQRRVITQIRRENDTAEKIREEQFKIAGISLNPPEWITGKHVKNGARGGPVVVWSDFHYGEVVHADQINGVNSFNASVAKGRFQKLVDNVVDLSFNHMGRAGKNYPGIVVCLGGDMIGGDIHEELARTNDRTSMQSVQDLANMLASGIGEIANKFGRVFIPCVVGNHGRSTVKPVMKNRVTTSYDWLMYCLLEAKFQGDKRVRFQVSNSADAHFKVYGHRFLLTHGDSLGVKGGDGIIGSIGPIMRGVAKLHSSKAAIGMDFDTALICHFHQYFTLPGIIVNGSLKGYDEFSMLALRAKYQRPIQSLTFVHPEHGITAQWAVYLEGLIAGDQDKVWVQWQE